MATPPIGPFRVPSSGSVLNLFTRCGAKGLQLFPFRSIISCVHVYHQQTLSDCIGHLRRLGLLVARGWEYYRKLLITVLYRNEGLWFRSNASSCFVTVYTTMFTASDVASV